MKHLIRRVFRVSDRSHYIVSGPDSSLPPPSKTRGFNSKIMKVGRLEQVPEGHLPVLVGEEMERFLVSAELLNHPIFVELLNQSADEYGYEQPGVLRLPCTVSVFEEVLETFAYVGDVH